jgi:hypothetical protein
MGYAKERGKLEKLSTKIAAISKFDEKNLAVFTDVHEQYSHTVRILKNKAPELFMELYANELQQVKAGKTALKESETDEAREENFLAYKAAILHALTETIKATQLAV